MFCANTSVVAAEGAVRADYAVAGDTRTVIFRENGPDCSVRSAVAGAARYLRVCEYLPARDARNDLENLVGELSHFYL